MYYRYLLMVGIVVCMASLGGCVSKARFEAVSNDYRMIQEKISEERDDLKLVLEESKKNCNQCRQDQVVLNKQIDMMRDETNLYAKKIEELDKTVNNKETVISLQDTVIRLFDDSKQTLQKSIQEQIASQNLGEKVTKLPAKIILVNKLLFHSGSAELGDEGKKLLEKMTGLLQEKQYTNIRVQGYTDDRPLKSTSKYADNWELSVARAITVVLFLHETVGIEPERMSATGFGQYRSIASNDTAAGRQTNRRIEIILETIE